jgi:hypothetical protein
VRYLRYLHREKGHEHRRSEPASQPARERERERGRKRERERERELVYVRMRKMTAPSYSSGNVEVHSVKFRLSPPHNVLGYSSLSRLRPSQCHTGRKKIAKGMDARKRKMRRRDTTRQDSPLGERAVRGDNHLGDIRGRRRHIDGGAEVSGLAVHLDPLLEELDEVPASTAG